MGDYFKHLIKMLKMTDHDLKIISTLLFTRNNRTFNCNNKILHSLWKQILSATRLFLQGILLHNFNFATNIHQLYIRQSAAVFWQLISISVMWLSWPIRFSHVNVLTNQITAYVGQLWLQPCKFLPNIFKSNNEKQYLNSKIKVLLCPNQWLAKNIET